MTTYYVRTVGGSDANSGLTPALAKATIGNAITTAVNDDTIIYWSDVDGNRVPVAFTGNISVTKRLNFICRYAVLNGSWAFAAGSAASTMRGPLTIYPGTLIGMDTSVSTTYIRDVMVVDCTNSLGAFNHSGINISTEDKPIENCIALRCTLGAYSIAANRLWRNMTFASCVTAFQINAGAAVYDTLVANCGTVFLTNAPSSCRRMAYYNNTSLGATPSDPSYSAVTADPQFTSVNNPTTQNATLRTNGRRGAYPGATAVGVSDGPRCAEGLWLTSTGKYVIARQGASGNLDLTGAGFTLTDLAANSDGNLFINNPVNSGTAEMILAGYDIGTNSYIKAMGATGRVFYGGAGATETIDTDAADVIKHIELARSASPDPAVFDSPYAMGNAINQGGRYVRFRSVARVNAA